MIYDKELLTIVNFFRNMETETRMNQQRNQDLYRLSKSLVFRDQ